MHFISLASELGWNHSFNPSSFFIEACEWLGLAYDLKKPSPQMVKSGSDKLGDGTYEEYIKSVRNSFGLKQCVLAVVYFSMPILVGFTIRFLVTGA